MIREEGRACNCLDREENESNRQNRLGYAVIIFSSASLPGSWGIISSGAFVIPGDVTGFKLPIEDLSFNVKLVRDGGKARLEAAEQTGEKEATLRLYNFDSTAGVAFTGAVGRVEDSELRLSLVVTTVGSGSTPTHPKTINYSFSKRLL